MKARYMTLALLIAFSPLFAQRYRGQQPHQRLAAYQVEADLFCIRESPACAKLTTANAQPIITDTQKSEPHKFKIFLALLEEQNNEQKRGCCSWHGGVCGCQFNRVVCCDGSYSPSCGC